MRLEGYCTNLHRKQCQNKNRKNFKVVIMDRVIKPQE